MLHGAELCRLLLVAGTKELFPSEARPALVTSRCGRLGVAVSQCRSSKSPRPPLFNSEPAERGEGVC